MSLSFHLFFSLLFYESCRWLEFPFPLQASAVVGRVFQFASRAAQHLKHLPDPQQVALWEYGHDEV